jgi:hypothetical protein
VFEELKLNQPMVDVHAHPERLRAAFALTAWNPPANTSESTAMSMIFFI